MSTGGSKTTQTLHIPFDSGMDQRTHPRQTQAGQQVLEAVNVRYNQLGGVEKRPGLTNVDNAFANTSRAFSGGVQGKLIANDGELIVTDGYHIGGMSVTAGVRTLVERSLTPEAVSKLKPVISSQYQISGRDSCYSTDGLIFHAWASGKQTIVASVSAQTDIYTTVEDYVTGAVLVSNESAAGLGTWWTPKVVACGNVVYLMWSDNAGIVGTINLYYKKWDRVNLVWGAKTTLRSDLQGDFAVYASPNFIYTLVSAANVVRATRYTSALAISADTALEVLTGTNVVRFGLAITARNNDAVTWAAYDKRNTATNVHSVTTVALDSSFAMSFAAPFLAYTSVSATVAIGVVVDESTNNEVLAITSGASASQPSQFKSVFPVYDVNANPVNNATPPNRTSFWVSVASKPFIRGSGSALSPKRAYVFAIVGGAIINGSNAVTAAQYTHMLLELGIDGNPVTWSPRPIAWQANRFASEEWLASPFSWPFWSPPSATDLSDGRVMCDISIKRNNRSRVSLSSHVSDFNPQNRFLNARLGQTVLMSPGFYWDRGRLAELSFAYWPQGLDAVATTTGGGLADGTYSYRALYEFIDGNGFVHQSIPSDPISAVVSGGGGLGKVTLTVPTLSVTSRQAAGTGFTSVRIVIYRLVTTGALSGAWSRLFAEGLEPLNDTTQQSISVVDLGNAGTSPTTSEELYTDSGVFPNVMPAGFTACVAYRNRVWIAYGHTVNYSKAFVTGSTVNFTDAFELPLEESGDITAMWVMDDTLYISTADRMYYLYADGPNDFGQQGDVNTPNRVATDFGCIEPRSVVVTQVGTLYQSRAGIQLLKRDRSVSAEPVGARVQTDLVNFPTITGATIHPDGRICTFSCVNTAGTLGIRLVYDYATDRWSRDTLLLGSDQSGSYVISEAVVAGKKYSLVSNGTGVSSRAYFENSATSLDDGGWVPMSISMGEVHPLGLQGNVAFLKWTVQQERRSAYNISAFFFKDYEAAPYQAAAKTDAQILAMNAPQFSFDTSIHRAQSMRVKLIDTPPAVLGTGFASRWIGLAVELDPLDNKTFKLPAANKG